MLMNWGPITFEIYPFNIGSVNHSTGSDWAKKEIAGAANYREWVGENDEEIKLAGKVFPHFFSNASRRGYSVTPRGRAIGTSSGGLGHLDVLDNMRRLGQAHALTRGDGWHFGWFVIETMSRGHTFLGPDGIGQQIEFEATFQRVPVPDDPAAYFPALWAGVLT